MRRLPRITAWLLVASCLALAQSDLQNPKATPANSAPQAQPPPGPAQQEPAEQPAEQPPLPPEKTPGQPEKTAQPSERRQPEEPRPKVSPNPEVEAWELLETGLHSDRTSERVNAVLALGLMVGNPQALTLAKAALSDDGAAVRRAAATSLGELHAKSSISRLKSALEDKDPSVVLAAAHALLLLGDESGYEVYYEIVSGERKASPGLIASQTSILKDPKQLAKLGFEEGIGFVPFAGIGWRAIKVISRDDSWQIRAAAAKVLADDPDPASIRALSAAVSDKNPFVRQAALASLAKRGNPTVLKTVERCMYDDKDEVRSTAAAVYLRLTAIRQAPIGGKRTGKRRTVRSLPDKAWEKSHAMPSTTPGQAPAPHRR